MHLSVRMHMVADMVPQSRCVADVGCDHGYLSIWLIREGIVERAIAMDLRKGPLARARENIRFFHQQERIETRLSDGVEKLHPGEADTIVIAGMGGELMSGILAAGHRQVQKANCLVLQPQSDVHLVRQQIRKDGYRIVAEDACYEDGKYYVVMRAEHGDAPKSEKPYADRYGTHLIMSGHPVYLEYLRMELGKKRAMIEQMLQADTPLANARLAWAKEEEALLVQALQDGETNGVNDYTDVIL